MRERFRREHRSRFVRAARRCRSRAGEEGGPAPLILTRAVVAAARRAGGLPPGRLLTDREAGPLTEHSRPRISYGTCALSSSASFLSSCELPKLADQQSSLAPLTLSTVTRGVRGCV